jgi:hypothetical protein
VSGLITVLAAGNLSVLPYMVGMALGFLIGAFGHLVKASAIILLGIFLIALTAILFVIATNPSFG